MKQRRITRKEFLPRARNEILARTGMDFTQDQVWILFCILMCTLFQMAVDHGRVTINNWISLCIESTTRANTPRNELKIRAGIPIQDELLAEKPNFFFTILVRTLFNRVVSDLDPERMIESEESESE